MDRRDLMHTDEEFEDSRNWMAKVRDYFTGHGDGEEDFEDEAPIARPAPARGSVLRMDQTRGHSIFVRHDFRTMEDAKVAADRLKERRPVIIDFQRTEPELAMRGVDFISGVTYALDGFYDKVADGVFLFTPSNLPIAVEDEELADRGASGVYGSGR